jgi:hypothetical protein
VKVWEFPLLALSFYFLFIFLDFPRQECVCSYHNRFHLELRPDCRTIRNCLSLWGPGTCDAIVPWVWFTGSSAEVWDLYPTVVAGMCLPSRCLAMGLHVTVFSYLWRIWCWTGCNVVRAVLWSRLLSVLSLRLLSILWMWPYVGACLWRAIMRNPRCHSTSLQITYISNLIIYGKSVICKSSISERSVMKESTWWLWCSVFSSQVFVIRHQYCIPERQNTLSAKVRGRISK